MEGKGFGRGAGWVLALGVLVGAILAPSVADAVGSIVTIQGGGTTTKANVTKGNQLQAAEAPPSSFRVFTTSSGPTGCIAFGSVPSTKGLVVRSIQLDVAATGSGGIELVGVYLNGTCSGNQVLTMPTKTLGAEMFPIEPGVGVAHGKQLSMKVVSSGAVVGVTVFGYLVPSADVPNTTPVSG